LALLRNPPAVYMTFFPNDETLDIISRHRRHTAYPIPRTRTHKYPSFIHFALAKYK